MALKNKMKTTKAVETIPSNTAIPSDILAYIKEKGIVTPSELQRKFRIGFSRAQELIGLYNGGYPDKVQVGKDSTVEVIDAIPVEPTVIENGTVTTTIEKLSAALVATPKKALKQKHEEKQEIDKAEGEKILAEAEKTVSELAGAESGLNHGYAKLAVLFNSISNNAYFQLLGFANMTKYLESLTEKYGKSRAQLCGYTATAKALLPYITPDELNAIGINKAKELTKVVKTSQTKPADDIIKAAIDPKVTLADLQKLLVDQHKIPAVEKGTWYDKLSQGFYATPEEQKLFDEAITKALRIANVGENVPDHLKRKVVLCMWAQEFLNVPEKSHE
jgi:hypothetical protein